MRWLVTLVMFACVSPAKAPPLQGEAPQTEAPPRDPSTFVIEATHMELRPFPVRLALVAAVLGVSTEHPLLQTLRDNHIELGDSDYAHGVQPNLVYTAQKLALWVASVRPICASYEMRTRFIGLPKSLDAFTTYGYGRPSDETDAAIVKEAIAEQGELTPEELYQAGCMALLSSAELLLK